MKLKAQKNDGLKIMKIMPKQGHIIFEKQYHLL